jgi:hypothetical protein
MKANAGYTVCLTAPEGFGSRVSKAPWLALLCPTVRQRHQYVIRITHTERDGGPKRYGNSRSGNRSQAIVRNAPVQDPRGNDDALKGVGGASQTYKGRFRTPMTKPRGQLLSFFD